MFLRRIEKIYALKTKIEYMRHILCACPHDIPYVIHTGFLYLAA